MKVILDRPGTTSCCPSTPERDAHDNAPGLETIAYRIGTWSSFFERMKDNLSATELPDGEHAGTRPLDSLTTRSVEDPTIALLDAWATVGEVLTFYQERIANEGFLRTATEPLSVQHLARQIGYTPKPGVAASTWLVFTLDTTEAAPASVAIPERLAVMSVPGQDELPQTFETVEAIEARPAFNTLRPKTTATQVISYGLDTLVLDGISTRLTRGDILLIVGDERRTGTTSSGSGRADERWDLRILTDVTADTSTLTTTVQWKRGLGAQRYGYRVDPSSSNPRVYVFRKRTSFYGHSAPDWTGMAAETKDAYLTKAGLTTDPGEWPAFDLADDKDGDTWQLVLDGEHKELLEDSWVAVLQDDNSELVRATDVAIGSRTAYAISAKFTRVTADDLAENLSTFDRRASVVLAVTEELPLAEIPIPGPLCGRRITLVDAPDGLEPGRTLLVTGTFTTDPSPCDDGSAPVPDETVADGERVSEVVTLESTETDADGELVLILESALRYTYVRDSVTIYANVAKATHGETVSGEVLGSGDGSATDQRFTLKKAPLTHVSAATASGAETTLEVEVDGVAWTEVPSFLDRGPDDRVYTVTRDVDGRSTVQLGDGVYGTRSPTGSENVRATYRAGLGTAGNVLENRLSLLRKRPLGVRQVTNPIAASGGDEPEAVQDTRDNAPLTVLTLDRLVSLQDYEDFASAFSGVKKALAVAVWNGRRWLVHLTVAGPDGAEIAPDSETYTNLASAIAAWQDPTQKVVLSGYTPRYFRVMAELRIDEAYDTDDVYGAAKTALSDTFSFDARSFSQAVTAAEIIATLQAVPGVVAVDLDALQLLEADYDPEAEASADTPFEEEEAEALHASVLVPTSPTYDAETRDTTAAELLLLDTSALAVQLMEMNG